MLWQTVCFVVAAVIFWKLLASLGMLIKQPGRQLPSPPRHWFWGHTKQEPYAPGFKWLRDAVQACPRAFSIYHGMLFPVPVMVHPDTVKPLISGAVPSAKVEFHMLDDWFGQGLIFLNGAKWKRDRRLLTHTLHMEVLRGYFPVFNDCTEVLLGKMEKIAAQGEHMKTHRDLTLCIFDIFLRAVCSHESNCQLQELSTEGGLNVFTATDKAVSIIHLWSRYKILIVLPWLAKFTPLYPQYKKCIDFLNNFARDLIERRRKEIESGPPATSRPRDFLATLLLARDEDGQGLTSREMEQEVNTFLAASLETTATTLTWLLYYMAKYPEHQNKIRQEVDEILADRDSDRITRNDIARLEYTTLVIKEMMRMITTSLEISRKILSPMIVEGVTLPAGTFVLINIYQLHHNPTVWGDDHMEFRPSRFLPENFTKMDPFAYLPFSAGSRNCIGQQFAMNEIKICLARIVRRFRLSLVEGEEEPCPVLGITVKPHTELLLTLEPIVV